MTSIVTVHSQKGGSGKSTLAANLYIQAVRAGVSAAIIDLDPQASLSCRFDLRSRSLLDLHFGDVPRSMSINDALTYVCGLQKDLVVVDTEPRSSERYVELARGSDLILVPVRPTVMDMEAAGDTVAVLRAAQALDRALFVVSQAPSQRGRVENRDVVESIRVLESYGLSVAPTIIRSRRDYSRSVNDGRGVVEAFPAGKAAAEIQALWQTVQARI